MERPRPRLLLATGLTFGVIVALLIIPATRYVVRTQTALVVPIRPPMALLHFVGSHEADTTAVEKEIRDYASGHSDDFRVQLSSALQPRNSSKEKVAALRALESKFPQNASLYANLLRFETQATVTGLRRDEEDLLIADPTTSKQPGRTVSTEHLAEFDRDAAEGERLEPDNAYFPLMRSIALFAGHRDSEAIEAIQRAAEKRRWVEHYEDELYGHWQVMEEALGERGGIPRTAVGAALLFPQYSQLRFSARVAVAKAVEAELAGSSEDGLRIRKAVMRCGELMRAEGGSLIGNFVGNSISILACSRPGGEPALKERPKLRAEQRGKTFYEKLAEHEHREVLFGRYITYLERLGQSEEAGYVRRVAAAGEQVRASIPIPHEADWSISLLTLGAWWMAGIFLLTNTLWMLILGAGATWLANSHRFKAGRPLSRTTSLGVGVALFLCSIPFAYLAALIGVGVVIGMVASALTRNLTWTDFRGVLAVMGKAIIGFAVVAGLIAWQVKFGSTYANAMFMLFGNEEGGNDWRMVSRAAMTLSFLPVIPLLALFAFTLTSRFLRVPAVTGVVRGFRGLALPIACALLIGYAVVVVGTARKEAKHVADMDRWIEGEGKFVCEILVREWPSRVE